MAPLFYRIVIIALLTFILITVLVLLHASNQDKVSIYEAKKFLPETNANLADQNVIEEKEIDLSENYEKKSGKEGVEKELIQADNCKPEDTDVNEDPLALESDETVDHTEEEDISTLNETPEHNTIDNYAYIEDLKGFILNYKDAMIYLGLGFISGGMWYYWKNNSCLLI